MTKTKAMTKEELKDKLALIAHYVDGAKVSHKFKGLTIPVVEFNEMIEMVWSEIESRDREIRKLNLELLTLQDQADDLEAKLKAVEGIIKQNENVMNQLGDEIISSKRRT